MMNGNVPFENEFSHTSIYVLPSRHTITCIEDTQSQEVTSIETLIQIVPSWTASDGSEILIEPYLARVSITKDNLSVTSHEENQNFTVLSFSAKHKQDYSWNTLLQISKACVLRNGMTLEFFVFRETDLNVPSNRVGYLQSLNELHGYISVLLENSRLAPEVPSKAVDLLQEKIDEIDLEIGNLRQRFPDLE
jgi:hypothetical protein